MPDLRRLRQDLAAFSQAVGSPLTVAAGTNAKALSAMMGHATITMTFDTYGHLMPGGLDEAAAAANAYIARLTGERPALAVVGS
jgi:integrase